jgi:hypothetical protein
MAEPLRPLLVVTTAAGRTFTVRPVDADGGAALYEGDRRLGELLGDLMPFVTGDSVVFLGDGGSAEFVRLDLPTRQEAIRVIRFSPGHAIWLSEPAPFVPGMEAVSIWQDGDGNELMRAELRVDDPPEPWYGPSWTSYAPLAD